MSSECTLQTDVSKVLKLIVSLSDFHLFRGLKRGYNHMGATIVDAILQAGLNYRTVVVPRVRSVLQNYPEANTTEAFLDLMERVGPEKVIAWRGSVKIGRMKAVTQLFADNLVSTETDLRIWLRSDCHIKRLQTINGIGPKTADYFKMLVGLSTVPIDRHVLRFIARAGVEGVKYAQAHAIVINAAKSLDTDPPSLDYSIWNYMSTAGFRGVLSGAAGLQSDYPVRATRVSAASTFK